MCVMGSAEVWGAIPGARLRESQCVPGRRAPAAGSMQRACCPPTQMAGAARLLYGHIWSSCRIIDSKVLSVSFVWFYVSLLISNLLFFLSLSFFYFMPLVASRIPELFSL